MLALRDDHAGQDQDHSDGADVASLGPPESIETVQLVSVLVSLRFEAQRTDTSEAISTTSSQDITATAAYPPLGTNELLNNEMAVEERSQGFESLLENNDFGPWKSYMDVNWPSIDSARKRNSKRRGISMAVLPLADIAIRSLICPRPTKQPAAISSGETNHLFNLASLAPAVFVPGYRNAVQSRAKFIPTIARLLCQFLQYSGPRLRCAPTGSGSKDSVIEPWASGEGLVQKKELKQHLWMTLTNGVKNVELARKLKPLHIARASKLPISPCTKFEDLLDTWSPYEDDKVVRLEDGFGDLHLEDKQDFADSEDECFSDLYDDFLSTSVGAGNVASAAIVQFDDEIPEVVRSSPTRDGTLDVTLNSACSKLWPERIFACALEATTACPEGRASNGLRTILDSSNSKLKEATESCISTSQPDMIGQEAPSNAYVSRKHPSIALEDEHSDSSRAEMLLLEQFELHAVAADSSISPAVHQLQVTTPSETQGASHVDNPTRKLLKIIDQDTGMPSYEKSNRSSLADVIGGDHLLWQMWTKRRPSMIQTDDDMLEMHTMYAQDPDMRLLDTHKELDDYIDDYMLDSETSNASSINSASSTNRQQDFMFPYGPSPVAERKHHHSFHLHKDSPQGSSQSEASRPTSRRKLSRGQSFFKRLSGSRAPLEEASNPSRPFHRDEPRELEIKRRKTLADYDKSSDTDDMLLR